MSLVRLRPVWMANHPPSVLWYCWLGLLTCKNHRLYNLYCVGGDVKPCSINQSIKSCLLLYKFVLIYSPIAVLSDKFCSSLFMHVIYTYQVVSGLVSAIKYSLSILIRHELKNASYVTKLPKGKHSTKGEIWWSVMSVI